MFTQFYPLILKKNRNFYGGGGNGTKLLILSQDAETGQLSYVDFYDAGPTPDGQWEPGSITVSPDDTTLYVTDLFADKV
ncbi:MAG: hypothetical protein ACREA4_05690, partial [Nitrososphaera sp.]